MLRSIVLFFFALLSVNMAAAQAQEQQFLPIMANFSGNGALVTPASPALEFDGAATIEFWVAAKWNGDPGYDPAIISCAGPQGARFSVHITADKQALGVYAGQYYDAVPFDFSDGQLHYVALTMIGDSIDILIDGENRGALGFGFARLPAETFSVGSLDNVSYFIGQIGQVRIWDTAVDPDVLNYFSWQPIDPNAQYPHPDFDDLVGVSSFGNPETSGFIFVGEQDEPDAIGSPTPPFDDSDVEQPVP